MAIRTGAASARSSSPAAAKISRGGGAGSSLKSETSCSWRSPTPESMPPWLSVDAAGDMTITFALGYRKPLPVASTVTCTLTHVKEPRVDRYADGCSPARTGSLPARSSRSERQESSPRGVRHRHRRQPRQAARPGLSRRRDLRRHQIGLGLRAVGGGAKGENQAAEGGRGTA